MGEAKKHESKHAPLYGDVVSNYHHHSQTRCYSIAIDLFHPLSRILSLHYAVIIDDMISHRCAPFTITLTGLETMTPSVIERKERKEHK